MKIVSPSEMAEMDKKTIAAGIADYELMERAAERCADYIKGLSDPGKKVLVLCGTGNNGGDGLVIARLLAHAGFDVSTLIVGAPAKMTPSTKKNFERLKAIGAPVSVEMTHEAVKSAAPDIIVDAVFGNGLTDRPIRPDMRALFDAVNALDAFVFAVDMPSGLRGDNGQTIGAAIKADVTLVIQHIKTGLLLNEGPDIAGRLIVVDVGIDGSSVETQKRLLTPESLGKIPKRQRQSHKYHYGFAGVIAGAKGMLGAGILACQAALKTGAGLVSNWISEDVYPIMAAKMPAEIMVKAYHSRIEAVAGEPKATVWLYGPGCGRTTDDGDALSALLSGDKPVVIDADGLWHLARRKALLKAHRAPLILTPHEGEFLTLAEMTMDELRDDPITAGKAFAQKYNLILVLKGHHTLIFLPDGRLWLNDTGNPGMATAGSGDVLAGMIAGFAAGSADLEEAVKRAVCLHGLAGDMAAERLGEVSLTASDLIRFLPKAVKSVSEMP